MSIYDFTVTGADGGPVNLGGYRGKVLLVVNTATGCGLTPQYRGLQELYEKYRGRGFEILDFPCNQFGHQAPGTDAEIGSFCELNYGTTFPRFKKIEVNGDGASPLYKWLKEQKSGAFGGNIKWNFTKFLVDRDGEASARFAPTKTPAALGKEVEKLL
ncbi:MAG: glutathione peroxidase [Oscillospiraceae bacterium]|jgi:glutathione peroxidase|nr:glutathione peroxidase [Oscillospiraceae bacterium]